MTLTEWLASATTLLVAVMAGVISGSKSVGSFTARLDHVEKQYVGRPEWQVFVEDLRRRLDRIEDKIDSMR